ncbi:MAG: hypothetical protein IJ480_05850 [Clostridia bacterium]|nr:hypothetical protein [Clostridia bacterium]
MKTRNRSADPAGATGALLTLFQPGNYMGEPYSIPGENQLRMTDTVWGRGNGFDGGEPFGEAMHLYGMTGVSARAGLEEALAACRFSVACGRADPVFIAARGMLGLMMHRHVSRFVVLVRGAAERESIALSLSAYLEQSARALPGSLLPELTIYANGESDMTGEGTKLSLLQLRRYVCDPAPQILLMNREYCNRPENLLLRPDVLLDGHTPLSMVTPARPVIVTISETAGEVRTLLERSSIFAPFCTLSFTEDIDRSGSTVPVYAPGMKQAGEEEIEMEQITI